MVKKEIFIFIQARTSSKRFPNKILKKIGKYIIIDLIKKRLEKVRSKKKIVFLIPNNKKNVSLKRFLVKRKYNYFLGDENNVLKRFYDASLFYKAKNIVRITADCPFIDFKMLNNMVKIYYKKKYDYFSNVYPKRTFPDGLDIEIFNQKALVNAYQKARSNFDIEHVTPYMHRSKKIKKFNYLNNFDASKIRVTIDYRNDLKKLNYMFKQLRYDYNFCFDDMMLILKKMKNVYEN